ncbi:MAG TPA: oligosaccharide flippase family protein [Polyangiaceae bacterium]
MPDDRTENIAAHTPASDVARVAGRGGLAVAFAKIYFIVTGLVQQIALPRFLGLDGYGALGTALSITSVTYNPVIGTSIQGVSRAVAQAPGNERAALRRTFVIHVALSTLLAAAFFALAPRLAVLIGAPHVSGALRILSAVIFVYGMYTPLVGALNGTRRFVHQAGLDIAAATLRTAGLVAGAYALSKAQGSRLAGVEGASWGFVAGALLVFLAALSIVGVGRSGPGGPSLGRHFAFIAPLFVGQVLLNFLLQADITLLRAFAAEAATHAGLSPMAADPYVGAYRATQLFSFLPYQLLIAVTFVLFPMLASAGKSRDRANVREYVATGLRLALVIAGAMVSVTSGLSEPLIRLVFGAEAAAHGARALSLLAIGFGAFAIFGILTTVLNSLGGELAATLVTLAAAIFVASSCFLFVRGTPLSDELLFRTAAATSAGIGLATILASVLVHRAAGGLVPLRVVVRVALAVLVATVLGRFLPDVPKLFVPALALLVAAVYAVMLVVTRELGASDLALVKRVVRRSA